MCQKGATVTVSNDNSETKFLRESSRGKAVSAQVVYPPPRSSSSTDDSKDKTTNTKPKDCVLFTRQQVADLHTNDGRLVIIIHDCVYDVTDYQAHHPGGSLVLNHLAGKDATDVFENYHRAHVAKYLLPSHFVGRLSDPAPVPAHVQDFRALRQELLARGMFEVQPTFYFQLYAWLAALFLTSLYCTLCGGTNFWVHMVGAVLMGLFWQQFAGLGHDLGHTAVSKSWHQDHQFGSIIGSCLTGLSTAWWKRNHNTHHVVPNSVEDDPNIQHMPLLAVSEQVISKPYWSSYYDRGFMLSRIGQAIVSYQHYIVLPLLSLARFNLYALGLKHLMDETLRSNYRNTELLCITGIFPLWYGAVALSLPTRTTMLAWIFVSHAVTILLHLQIVVSHWSMETYRYPKEDDDATKSKTPRSENNKNNKKSSAYDSDDWYMLQFRTTMDIACPAWLDWLHIGLQFQTVHHLYPTLPRPHQREATAMVKQVCAKHDITFSEMGFLPMVGDSLRVLRETAALARTGKYTRNHLAEALRAEG